MRKFFTTAALVCLVASFGNTADAQSGIPWLTDWRQARDLAQQQHRLVLLHFWSESCAPCKRLEQKVFNRPEVVRAFQSGYIPVKINVDEEPRLANHYGVNSWPTDVIVDPDGRVLDRRNSPPEANQYVAFLDSIKTHHAVAMLPSGVQQPRGNEPSAETPASSPSASESTYQPSANRNSDFVLPAKPVAPQQAATPAATGRQERLKNGIASKPAVIGKPYANPYLLGPGGNQSETNASSQAPNATAPANAGPGANGNPDQGNATASAPTAPRSQFNAYASRGAGSHSQMPVQTPAAASQMPTQQQPSGAHAGSTPWNLQAARQAMMPNPPQRPPLPTRSETVGLESYCPVTLVEGNVWARGNPAWGAIHHGRTYLFTSEQNQQRFLSNPDAYAPVLSGYDPVQYVDAGSVVEGKRRHGLYYGSKYFLFSDEANLQKFQTNPVRYMPTDMRR